jgi:hypothetical protein
MPRHFTGFGTADRPRSNPFQCNEKHNIETRDRENSAAPWKMCSFGKLAWANSWAMQE